MTLSTDSLGLESSTLVIKAVNGKGDPVIYITDDRSLNTLVVTIINSTGAELTLKGGAPVSEKDVKRGGPSAIYLNFGSMLTADQCKGMKVVADGWGAQYFGGTAQSWGLTPKSDMIIAKDAAVAFTISQFGASGQSRSSRLVVDYYNIGALRDGSQSIAMMLQEPPSLHKALQLEYGFVGDDRIFVTHDEPQRLVNSLRFFLSNPSPTEPIVKASTSWENNPPTFIVSFAFGERPGYGALCSLKEGKDITINPVKVYENRWKCDPHNQNEYPQWILTPKDHEILGTGLASTVEFSIETIVSHLESGVTLMYVQYRNIPGYDNGYFALSIRKENPTPGIRSFEVDEANINADEEVHLSWDTFDAAMVELSFQANGRIQKLSSRNNEIQLKEKNFPLRPQSSTTYTLSAYDVRNMRVGSSVQRIVSVDTVRIKTFTVTPALYREDLDVELKWSTQNADRCTLNPGDLKLAANSDPLNPLKLRPKKGQPGYELTAWKGERSSVPRTVLLMPHPFPREFPVPPFPLDLYPMEPIASPSGSRWASEFMNNQGWMLPEGGYNAGGHFVESTAGKIFLKGPSQVTKGIRYFALTAVERRDVYEIYAGGHFVHDKVQGWQGGEWGKVPAINSNGYHWYRMDLDLSGFESNDMFTIYRSPAIFKMWAFKGIA